VDASNVSVSGDTVVVDLWGPASEAELRALAEALVGIVRDRQRRGVRRPSKVETKLRAVMAEAMSDSNVMRVSGPAWAVSFVHCRMMPVGPDGAEEYVILTEQTVRVAVS
jgi:hypothetical protein